MSRLIGVVDDDASVLRALHRLLGSAGFAVKTFGSGEELLASEHLHKIDCLVLDVHLGGLSAFQLRESLSEAVVATPIIFITAHDDGATRERARRAGAVEYLCKPFEEHALIAAIHKALGPADSSHDGPFAPDLSR